MSEGVRKDHETTCFFRKEDDSATDSTNARWSGTGFNGINRVADEAATVPVAAWVDLPDELLKQQEQAFVRIDISAENRAIEEIRDFNNSLADALASTAQDL